MDKAKKVLTGILLAVSLAFTASPGTVRADSPLNHSAFLGCALGRQARISFTPTAAGDTTVQYIIYNSYGVYATTITHGPAHNNITGSALSDGYTPPSNEYVNSVTVYYSTSANWGNAVCG